MRLLLLGVSHHTAPVDLRERLAFPKAVLPDALTALATRSATHEAVIVSTCNRAEIYASCDDADRTARALGEFLADFHGIDRGMLVPYLYAREDVEAARHLFRVAGGLDSLVVGEPQILGQVKDAFSTAAALHTTGPVLNKLFHWSFAAGKRVRTETGLGEGAVSVSYAAVALARKIFGELKGLNVLVVGAGEMAKLTATHLKAQGVARMVIVSRTLANAEGLAEELNATPAPWSELDRRLASSDIVVTATGSPEPVITRDRVAAVMHARRNRPLFLIDIAVPRDVDPDAGSIEQVFVYNIDDLQAIVNENMARRASEIERAEAIVAEEVERFAAWLRAREAIPTVIALRQRFENIRQAELARLQPKLAALPPEGRARVDEITRLIVEKLLLTPTEQLKSIGDRETVAAYSDALSRLFNLGGADPAEPAGEDEPPAAPRERATTS